MDPTLERRRIVGSVGQFHRTTIRSADQAMSVGLQIGLDRGTGLVSFIGAVLEEGREPLVVVDSSIVPSNDSWEVRGDGIWVDHVCETPFEHWSYGLEAFGLRLDDPAELLGRGFGYREPLGWELEFESTAKPEPQGQSDGELGGYRQDGTAHGLVLFKGREVEIDGSAVRQHWWHDHNDAAISVAALTSREGDRSGGARVALPQPAGTWWLAVDGHKTEWTFDDGTTATTS